jgi:metallo-beta-lactamase family protein
MPVTLSFHGGVDIATRSCHLLSAGCLPILLDCGLFQGEPQFEENHYDDFVFDPSLIYYLLLAHGHPDRCGRMPVLIKKGFNGKIITTSVTCYIAKIIILDSAKIYTRGGLSVRG